jgi:tetratricopeptide (TPR) repeat protein
MTEGEVPRPLGAAPPFVTGRIDEALLPDPADGSTPGIVAISGPVQPLVVPRQLPAAPGHFVGRQPELRWLAGLGGGAGGQAVGVISGLAGVGKTALALHWAHQVAGRFPDGQLYADLGGFGPSGSPVEAAVALHGFLDGLGVPAERIPRDLAARAGLYRSLVAGRRMLIVLDNARDAEQVRPLLPGSPRGLVLVTSRARLAGLAVDGTAGLLALDVLSDQEARELLAVRVGASRVAREAESAAELTRLCARLPLAVAIVAARAVDYPGLPLAALTAELRDTARRLDGLDAGDAATSIRAVLSWSYEQLAELPARMLRLLAIHPGPGIAAAAAASMAGIPLSQARPALRALGTVSLITEYLPGRYALHELVRAFAAEQARGAGHAEDLDAAIGRMLDHYLHTANIADALASHMTLWEHEPYILDAPRPGVLPERLATRDRALAWCDAERAVLVKVTGQAAETGFDAHAWQLAGNLALFLRLRGHWPDLLATQGIALAAARRQRHRGAQARVDGELGCAFAHAGQFRRAHAHQGRALRLYQELGDQDGEARTRISMSMALGWQGRDREALAATRAALLLLPGDSPSSGPPASRAQRARVLNNLGWFQARLGELDQARAQCGQALRLYRDIGNRYGEAVTLDSLGYICDRAGEHDRAIAYYRLAVGQLRQLGARYEAADVLARLGDICQALGDDASARDAWQQAVQELDGMQRPGASETVAKLRQLNATSGHVQ